MGCHKASSMSCDDMRTRPRAMENEVFHGLVERIEKDYVYKGESCYEVQRTVYPGENRQRRD